MDKGNIAILEIVAAMIAYAIIHISLWRMENRDK